MLSSEHQHQLSRRLLLSPDDIHFWLIMICVFVTVTYLIINYTLIYLEYDTIRQYLSTLTNYPQLLFWFLIVVVVPLSSPIEEFMMLCMGIIMVLYFIYRIVYTLFILTVILILTILYGEAHVFYFRKLRKEPLLNGVINFLKENHPFCYNYWLAGSNLSLFIQSVENSVVIVPPVAQATTIITATTGDVVVSATYVMTVEVEAVDSPPVATHVVP
jgi:hypothetical protein